MMRKFLIFALLFALAPGFAPSVAQATVENEISRNNYTGNGTTTVYPYTFRILNANEIRVIVGGTTQTLNTDYSVSNVGTTGGGNITFVSAPGAGAVVSFLRNVPLTQTTDYIPNQAISADVLERNFDKLTMITQMLEERADRSITLSQDSTLTSLIFPSPGAGLCIAWNAGGTALEAVTCGSGGGGGGGGITSLNNLTALNQIFVNDSNISIVSGGSSHTITWGGTLPVVRGGTGADNAPTARTNLGLGNLAVFDAPVTVALGGTGQTSLTADQLLLGAGTSPVAFVATGPTNSVLTGTGGPPAFNTQPTLVSLTTTNHVTTQGSFITSAQAALLVGPFGTSAGNTGELRLFELVANGSNYVGIKAPDSISANKIWVWPAADGSSGHVLTTNGSGVLTFAAPGGGGSGITSLEGQTGATQTFADDTNVTISSSADVHTLGWTGQLSVARGGTGAASLTDHGVLVGSGTAAIDALAVGATGTVLAGSTGADPAFTATPTVTGITTTGQAAHVIGPHNTSAGNTGEARLLELAANGTNYVGFKAPDAITGNVIWTLPATDGSSGQALTTNGSGVLSFATISGGGSVSGSGAADQVAFWSAASTLASDAMYTWNNTSKKLSIDVGDPVLTKIGKRLAILAGTAGSPDTHEGPTAVFARTMNVSATNCTGGYFHECQPAALGVAYGVAANRTQTTGLMGLAQNDANTNTSPGVANADAVGIYGFSAVKVSPASPSKLAIGGFFEAERTVSTNAFIHGIEIATRNTTSVDCTMDTATMLSSCKGGAIYSSGTTTNKVGTGLVVGASDPTANIARFEYGYTCMGGTRGPTGACFADGTGTGKSKGVWLRGTYSDTVINLTDASTTGGAHLIMPANGFIAFSGATNPASIFSPSGSSTHLTMGLAGLTSGLQLNVEGAARVKGPTPWIDIRAHGAVAGGTASTNRAAIQAAHDAAASVGGIIYIPPGDYSVDGTSINISKGVTIRGDGVRASRLFHSTGTGNVFSVTTVDPVTFQDFAIEAGTTQTANAYIIFNASGGSANQRSVIRGMRFTSCFVCINFAAAAYWKITDSDFITPVNTSVIIENSVNNEEGDNLIEGSNFNAIAGSTLKHVSMNTSSGLRVSSTKFLGGATQLHVNIPTGADVSLLQVVNSSFENYNDHGIRITTNSTGIFQRANITGNEFALTESGSDTGILIDGSNASAIAVVGNNFRILNTASNAVYVTAGSNIVFSGNLIICNSASTNGININDGNAGPTTITITGNRTTSCNAGIVANTSTLMNNNSPVTTAHLFAPVDGSTVYCTDCSIANPCGGSSSGAYAKRVRGAWVCN